MNSVAILLSSLGSGGAERVAVGLANAWVGKATRVTLVPTHSNFDGSSFYAIDDRVDVVPVVANRKPQPPGAKYWGFFLRLYRLRRLVLRVKPDVVIAFMPNVNVAAVIATAFTGIPNAIGERSDPSAQPIGLFWQTACALFYRFTDVLTVQTSSVAQKIPALYGGIRRVEVMPNPLPEGLLAYQCQFGRAVGRRVLLSLGRLAPEKQIDQIITVFSQLVDKHSDWDLHIYGDGPLAPALLAQAVALGLQDRVMFKGATRQPWQVMENADLFVMNSRFEGFPNALLEAMGVGLPCVAADCPSGPREISRDGRDAILFAPRDLEGMRTHLDSLMADHPRREELGRQARASVSERYSLTSVLKRWEALLASIEARP